MQNLNRKRALAIIEKVLKEVALPNINISKVCKRLESELAGMDPFAADGDSFEAEVRSSLQMLKKGASQPGYDAVWASLKSNFSPLPKGEFELFMERHLNFFSFFFALSSFLFVVLEKLI